MAFAELPNGSADTIVSAIEAEFIACKLDQSRLVGFASDGASVMTGVLNGRGKLRAKAPQMVSTHCLAHRLALAAQGPIRDPGDRMLLQYIVDHFFVTLQQIHSYFDNSSVRTAKLAEFCKKMDISNTKLVQPSFTRWLSHDAVVRSVKLMLPALHAVFKQADNDNDNRNAHGLLRCISEYCFIACLLMFGEILPPFARLSRVFQKDTLDFSIVDAQVNTLSTALDELNQVN